MNKESAIGYYKRGLTPFFASRMDQRFSFAMYLPVSYTQDHSTPLKLLVAMHDTTRKIERYRLDFRELADAHGCMILCPLFPAGIEKPWSLDSYKFLRHEGINYDRVLLSMIEEVSEIYPLQCEKFLMFGFSGGAHFAHRFLYVHPERLGGVVINAPGIVTLLDPEKPWFVGVSDFEDHFGHRLDIDAISRVPVQLLVGANDTETWEITCKPDSAWWIEGINDSGSNRIERITALKASLQQAGVQVKLSMIPGKGHEPLVDPAAVFFKELLSR